MRYPSTVSAIPAIDEVSMSTVWRKEKEGKESVLARKPGNALL